jgi:hypothetical protein
MLQLKDQEIENKEKILEFKDQELELKNQEVENKKICRRRRIKRSKKLKIIECY